MILNKLNRQYVSGFTGSSGVLLITLPHASLHKRQEPDLEAILYVDDRYLIRARKESPFAVKQLGALKIDLKGFDRVGVEDEISIREHQDLKKIKKNGYTITRDLVRNLRAVKTPDEIKYITKAQGILDETFHYIRQFVQRNYLSHNLRRRSDRAKIAKFITENEIALEIESHAKQLGADGMAFESIVAFGANAAAPHHLAGTTAIKPGNFLLLDFGVKIKNYHSDFTRTLFVGKPNRRQELIYNTVIEAQHKAISSVQSGTLARAVDGNARDHIASAGFADKFTHNTGHGVGLEIHELPNLSPTSADVLHDNMIVTVEPGIYIENQGGVRIEDMVLVEKKGPRLLSKIPRDLGNMIIK